MKKKFTLLVLLICFCSFSQNVSYTFVNARNTNDGVDDFYEADVYISSDTDFSLGSGQLYFNYNTAAFGDNVVGNSNFEMIRPAGSLLATSFFGGAVFGYESFIVNDNTNSRVSTAWIQAASSGALGDNVTSTPVHLYSIKIKYVDINEDPTVTFETGSTFTGQIFTGCGPSTAGFAVDDCSSEPGAAVAGESFDSSGAILSSVLAWSGVTGSDWNTSTNWLDGVIPVSTDNVAIPSVTNFPIIGENDAILMNDLTIETGAELNITNNGFAAIAGDFNSNGTVTMSSTTTQSSSLIVAGTASGDVTYVRDGLVAKEWSIVSVPVHGQSIKEFFENPANDIDVNTTVTPNRIAIAYYDDSNAVGSKWVYYTTDDIIDNSLTFEKGRGYIMSRVTNGSVTFTGTLETASVTKTVIASQWNAIGNPYTAFLPVNNNAGNNFINDNSAKMDPAYVGVYTWDNVQAKYVANTLTSEEKSIAPGQGFFVHTTTGVGDLTLDASKRTSQPSTGGVFARGTNTEITNGIELFASANGVKVSTEIQFHDTATKGLNPGYDVGNFDGAQFDVFTQLLEDSKGIDFTIQSLSNNEIENQIIPVGITAEAETKIDFTVKLKGVLEGKDVYLEDKVNNTFTNLSETKYSVTIKESINGIGQFYLHTSARSLDVDDIDAIKKINIYSTENKEVVIAGLPSKARVSVFNVLGAQILNKEIEGSKRARLSVPIMASGVYIIKLQSDIVNMSKKVIIK
jgi:hypothetical protein